MNGQHHKVEALAVLSRAPGMINAQLPGSADLIRQLIGVKAAVAELIAADREYDDACLDVEIHGTVKAHDRLRSAVHSRKAALARVGGAA